MWPSWAKLCLRLHGDAREQVQLGGLHVLVIDTSPQDPSCDLGETPQDVSCHLLLLHK